MTQYISPLVDVNEIDLSTTIPAIATAIGVIVVRNTWKGDELKVKLVNSIDELIEAFGRPEAASDIAPVHGQSYEDLLAGTGFLQFAQNLYCTRVLPPSATFAGVYGTIDELGASVSSSSSSTSTACVSGWVDVTLEANWISTYSTWNGSGWDSGSNEGANVVNLDPVPGAWITGKNPPKIKFNVTANVAGQLDFELWNIYDGDGGGFIYGGPGNTYLHSVSAVGVPQDIIIGGLDYISDGGGGYYDFTDIYISNPFGSFTLNSIEFYEDCQEFSYSSSSSSESTAPS